MLIRCCSTPSIAASAASILGVVVPLAKLDTAIGGTWKSRDASMPWAGPMEVGAALTFDEGTIQRGTKVVGVPGGGVVHVLVVVVVPARNPAKVGAAVPEDVVHVPVVVGVPVVLVENLEVCVVEIVDIGVVVGARTKTLLQEVRETSACWLASTMARTLKYWKVAGISSRDHAGTPEIVTGA